MQASSPEASCTFFNSIFATSIAMVRAPERGLPIDTMNPCVGAEVAR
jgi:hypothetical protein